jgi:hypothetical protein
MCGIYHLNRRDVLSAGKLRRGAIARTVLAFGSVGESGMSVREAGDKLCLSPSQRADVRNEENESP